LGGKGRFIEIDESCIVHQKHHRGKAKVGTKRWIFGGIERGEGGRAFAIRVEDRKIKTLDKLILERIKPKTTIISDDWPAYRNLGKRLGKPIGFKHFIICHKKQFARYAYFFNLFNFLERLLKMIFL
jgi:hypothetical protein